MKVIRKIQGESLYKGKIGTKKKSLNIIPFKMETRNQMGRQDGEGVETFLIELYE